MWCFLPGSQDGNFVVLKFTVSGEIYVGIPGIFLYISKDFSGTEIYHSDIINVLPQINNLFFAY